jgi:hypothetical protein
MAVRSEAAQSRMIRRERPTSLLEVVLARLEYASIACYTHTRYSVFVEVVPEVYAINVTSSLIAYTLLGR